MHTIDCDDSSCVKCRQDSDGQSSEEENQKILMTVEELVSNDLLLASDEKEFCLESCNKIKDQIHFQISKLVFILRERERHLCAQVDQECCAQMAKIDRDATVRCIDKLLKRNSEPEKTPCRRELVFTWEHYPVFPQLKKFGRLIYVDPEAHLKKECQTIKQEIAKPEKRLAENTAWSTTPLVNPFGAPSMAVTENEKLKNLISSSKDEEQHLEEGTDSVPSKEVGKDGSSDEDDMEIISRSEAAAAPSESPALPPKSRFRFGRKRSGFSSLFSKKPLLSRENSSASKRPICSETKSQECVTASIRPGMCEAKELPSFHERAGQESSGKCLTKSESSITPEAELPSSNEPSNKESSGKCLTKSESSIILEAQSSSFSEPSSQESSSKCLGDSSAVGQSPDPSVALQSSFTKYLEKNPDHEWLVPEKSSERSPSSGNSCILSRHVPFIVDNLDQWLSTKTKQKAVSDWLYTARV